MQINCTWNKWVASVLIFVVAATSEILLAEPTSERNLTLKDCFHLALLRSEQIAISKENVEETTAQLLQALSQGVGDLDFVITNNRQQVQKGDSSSAVASTLTASSRRERKFTYSQPLFQGFKAFGAITGVGSLSKQRQVEVERAKELLFLDVVHAFYSIFQNQKDIEILEADIERINERIGTLKEREKIGRSRPSEVSSAIATLKSAQARLALGERVLINSVYVLEFLTGIPIETGQLVDSHDVLMKPTAGQLPEYLKRIEYRNDVLIAKQNITTNWKGVIIAQSGVWPHITLEGNQYQKREGFQSGIDWDMLFKIDIPLFKGFETAGNIKESMSEWKKAKLSYALTRREAELAIKHAYENWVSSKIELKAFEEATLAYEEDYRLQKEDYTHSLVNNLEVLESLKSLNEAKTDENRVCYEAKQNYWELLVAAGYCCEKIFELEPTT